LSPFFDQLRHRTTHLTSQMKQFQAQSKFEELNKKLGGAGVSMSQKGYLSDGKKRISQEEAFNRLKAEQARIEKVTAAQRMADLDRSYNKYLAQQSKIHAEAARKAVFAMPGGMEELSQLQRMGTQLGTMQKQGINVNAQMAEMKKRLDGNVAAMRAFNNGILQGKKSFDMFNLSLLFGGMMMQRAGLAILRFAIPSMDKLNQLNTAAAKKVMGVQAAFEFLKISIFETIAATPFFQWLVEAIIKMVVWISEMAQKHPIITSIVVALGGLGALLGTAFIIAAGWGQIGSMLTGAWAVVKKMVGVDGISGKIGTALTGFKNMMTNFGIVASLVLTGLSVSDLIKSIQNQDWGGVLGNAISAALGLGAAGLLFAGFTGAGFLILLAGTVIYTITKMTIDDRKAVEALDTYKGKEKKGPISSWFAGANRAYQLGGGFFGLEDEALSKTNQKRKAEESKAYMNYLGKYSESYKTVQIMKNELDKTDATNVEHKMMLNDQILKKTQEMSTYQEYVMALGGKQGAEDITRLTTYINLLGESKKAIEEKATTVAEQSEQSMVATQAEIDNYVSVFGEQLKSVEKTQELIDNTVKFGNTVKDVFGGTTETVGVIGQFNAFGKEIVLDNTYFTTLKNDIDTWASTVTYKSVVITYTHVNSGNDNGSGNEGFFEETGREIDELFAGGEEE